MNRQRRRPGAERVEIALERGQVTTVLVGSVVALGLVFLTGVAFGSRLASAAEPPAEESGASAVTAAAGEAPELTFHDALTTRRTGGSSAAAGPETAPPRAAEAPSAQPPAPPAPERPRAEPSAPRASTPEPAAAPAPRAPAPSAAAAGSGPTFTVQVSSSRDEADTRRLADRLEAAGWDARVVAADIEGRGRWYRVRVGRYDNREEAMGRQAELQQSFRLSGLVVAEQ